MEYPMHSKIIFLIFCSILVAGTIVVSGCTRAGGSTLPEVTYDSYSGIAAPSPMVTSSSSCAILPTEFPMELSDFTSRFLATELLTKPTKQSVEITVVPKDDAGIFFVYGTQSGSYSCQTPTEQGTGGQAVSGTIRGLVKDMQYYYRTCAIDGKSGETCGPERTFHTARLPGSGFTFGVQADSHPEREKTMFSSDLYRQTLQNVVHDNPDFISLLGTTSASIL
jgi:hypothetical protein